MMNHLTNQLGKDSKTAQEKFGKDKLEIKYLESKQDADYVQNIETFADEEMDLIIGVGFKLAASYNRSMLKTIQNNNLH